MSDQPPDFIQNGENDRIEIDDNPPEPVSSANGNYFPPQHQVAPVTEQSFDPVSSSSALAFLNYSVIGTSTNSFIPNQNNHENALENIGELPREPSFSLAVEDSNPELPLPSCSSSFHNASNISAPSSIDYCNDIPIEPSQGDELVSSTTSHSNLNFQQRLQVESQISHVPTFDNSFSNERNNIRSGEHLLQNEQHLEDMNFTTNNLSTSLCNSVKSSLPTTTNEPMSSAQIDTNSTQLPFSHPSDPTKFYVDKTLLVQVLEYGFSEYIATLAIQRTHGAGVEQAVNWVIDHSNISDIKVHYDEESKREMGSSSSQPIAGNTPETSSASSSKQNSLSRSILQSFKHSRSHKMVFVANMGLKMGTGKLAAQVGHATLGVYRAAHKTQKGRNELENWTNHGEVKIVVKGQSTEQLLDLFKQAKELGLHAYLVQDAGYTQIPPGSRTVLGVFGALETVDQITGSLKLL